MASRRRPCMWWWTCLVVLLAAPHAASAQGQLVPIVTSDSPLPLPNEFGLQTGLVRNQAGDFAVLDSASSAVFLRPAGAPAWVRVIEVGDEVPGFAGSRVQSILALRLNASGLLALGVDFNLASGEPQGVILTYNGSSLTKVVAGTDTAPNSGGARFERGIALNGLNDIGDILFTAPLVPNLSGLPVNTTVFILPSGGAPVRVVGLGDPAPGTPFTFGAVTALQMLNNGEAFISSATLVGGGGGAGLFVGTTTGLRKVAATGDANPNGGVFTTISGGRMNHAGRVVFVAGGAIWIGEPNSALTPVVGPAAPSPLGGTMNTYTTAALNDAGTVVFTANLTGASAPHGVFRWVSGSPLQTILYRGQPAPGTATTFQGVTNVFMNAGGEVALIATRPDGNRAGFYYQSGGDVPVPLVVQGGPSGVPGGGPAELIQGSSFLGTIFDNGQVAIQLSMVGGAVDNAIFLRTAAGATSMVLTTNDLLPAGGRRLLQRRTFGVWGAGTSVSFMAMRAGGAVAAFVHDLSTQSTTRVAREGDIVQGTGERLRITSSSSVFVNAAGQAVIFGQMYGGPMIRSAVVVASASSGLEKVAADGDLDSVGRVLTEVAIATLAPTVINDSGQVVFGARGAGTLGLWVGTPGVPAVKVAMVGDLTFTGATITGIGANVARTINAAGQVLFYAATTSGNGLHLATPGGAIRRIAGAGDAAPGGGTFVDFSMGSLNANGEVAFVATTTGAGGGVFLGSTLGPPVAIATHGGAAPGGGTYVLNALRPGALINDQADVLFLADLSGSAADSGYFIRRGPAGAVQSLVREGDLVPGTGYVFQTLRLGLNTILGEFQQLNSAGGVSFLGDFFDGSGRVSGYWHITPGGVVEEISSVGGVSPAFGGGVAVRTMQLSSWAGLKYPTWARLTGGSFVEGLFLFVQPTPTPVFVGTGIGVTPIDSVTQQSPVDLTFAEVTSPGSMWLTVAAAGPALPPGYVQGNPPRFYNLTTTATFVGPIEVCVTYTQTTFPPASQIRLLHRDGNTWSDITTSVNSGLVCGSTMSLSPFVVARLTTPGPNVVQNGDFAGGTTNWLTFATPDDTYIQYSVNSGVFEYYRVPPPPGTANQAVVFQRTGVAIEAGAPLVATFDLGNSSPVRKRISVLIQDSDFTDLFACIFWLPANLPLTTYEVRTHTTKAWANATIAFYAASAGSNGGVYRIDNVTLRTFADGQADRTECVDPTRPTPPGGSASATLLTNGDFETGLPPWGLFGQIAWQIVSGVFEFHRLAGTPAGVVKQESLQSAAVGEIFTATFELGNTFTVRRRATILVHDNDFTDLAACTFWLDPSQPLRPYEIRMFATKAWTNATISVYAANVDTGAWFQLDNVTMRRTPGPITFNGTDCIEPPSEPVAQPPPPLAGAKGKG